MSWYIEYLLRNKNEIKESIISNTPFFISTDDLDESYSVVVDSIDFEDSDIIVIADTLSLDSDVYDDVLSLEKLISDLHKEELLDDDDFDLINVIGSGESFTVVEDILDVNRWTISKRFMELCDDLDYYSKGVYSDKAILDKLKQSKNLNEDQVKLIEKYMKSILKNKILKRST